MGISTGTSGYGDREGAVNKGALSSGSHEVAPQTGEWGSSRVPLDKRQHLVERHRLEHAEHRMVAEPCPRGGRGGDAAKEAGELAGRGQRWMTLGADSTQVGDL